MASVSPNIPVSLWAKLTLGTHLPLPFLAVALKTQRHSVCHLETCLLGKKEREKRKSSLMYCFKSFLYPVAVVAYEDSLAESLYCMNAVKEMYVPFSKQLLLCSLASFA